MLLRFGLPDERWGECVAVAIVLAPSEQLTYEELERHCRQQLAGFKVPRRMFVRSALPRNASGKLLKPPVARGAFQLGRDRDSKLTVLRHSTC